MFVLVHAKKYNNMKQSNLIKTEWGTPGPPPTNKTPLLKNKEKNCI